MADGYSVKSILENNVEAGIVGSLEFSNNLYVLVREMDI